MSDRIDELMRSLHEKPRVADQSLIEHKLQALRTPKTPKQTKPRDGKNGIDGVDGAAGADGTSGNDGKAGADGANGRNGVDGVAGAPGAIGEQGEQGDAGMNWRGTYRSDLEYWIGDVVGVSGSAYVCVAATNQAPPIGFGWELLVSRGAQGIRGIKGEDGTGGGGAAAAGTLTGTTLAANVVVSSFTTVGTLEFLTVTNTITGSINGTAATATTASNALSANSALTATTATTAGTVTTAAQPTITSVGTLTAVNTSGVITGTNTTASTSSTTGAVIIAGGAGIAKDSYINTVRVGLGAAGSNNTTLGASTGTQLTAGSAGCTMVGYQSGFWNSSGNGNTSVGQNCLLNTRTGSWNSALGINAIYTNQSGSHNVSVGLEGLYNVTSDNNTGIGSNSGYHLTGASTNNICIGYIAGKFQADGSTALTTSSNSCYIGTGTRGLNNSDSNSVVIGANAIGIGANTTVIGTSSTTETKLFGQLTLDATACISAASATSLALKTVVPAGTGVTPTVQVICPSSAYTLTNGTGQQKVFDLPQDTITLQAATTYMFDGQYLITTGTTTHITSMSFVLTTATMTNCSWNSTTGMPTALNAATSGSFHAIFNSVAGGNVNTTSGAANKVITFRGIMRVNAAGTLVPNIGFSAAPGVTCSTLVGSYIRFYPIGANTISSVGTAIG